MTTPGIDALRAFVFESVRSELAAQMLRLCEKHKAEYVSLADFADRLGAERPRVARVLVDWTRQGLLRPTASGRYRRARRPERLPVVQRFCAMWDDEKTREGIGSWIQMIEKRRARRPEDLPAFDALAAPEPAAPEPAAAAPAEGEAARPEAAAPEPAAPEAAAPEAAAPEAAAAKPAGEAFAPQAAEGVDAQTEQEIRKNIAAIPPLPLVAQQLLAELHSPKSSAQSLANIAIKDPAITMSLLKMANSAFYGQRDEVTDVQRAIVVIGLRSVRHMVVAAGIGRIFRRPRGRKGYNFDALWTHALGTSVAARLLARRTHALTEAQAGTLGLLHDIGKFAMNVAAPKLTAQLLNPFDGPEEASGLAKEVMLFGTTHAIYGMRLLEAWKLPHEVARIVEYHHHPAYAEVETLHEDIMRGLSLVHIANQLAKMGGLECGDRTIEHIPDACFEMLGLAPDLEALYDDAMTATFEQARYFVQRAAQDSPGAGR